MKDLHNKYRPDTLDGVFGQDDVVESLTAVLEEERNKSFLFVGPSGTGKTTLARIIAHDQNLEIREIDAATNNGIDAMRELKEGLRFSPLSKKKGRIIIVDECHSLSKSAWQALLKDVEEPPRGVYWAFCTTEAHKVPATIKTRCASYVLSPVGEDELFELLSGIVSEEGAEVSEEVIQICVEKSSGSPRQAITNLAKVADCETRKAAARLLQAVDEDEDVIKLCRAISQNANWDQLMKVVKKLPTGISTEGLRRQVFAYFSKVASGSKGSKAGAALTVLSAFGEPYPDDSLGHVILSIGEICFGEEE